MTDSIQLIVNGVTVYQVGASAPAPAPDPISITIPAPAPPAPAPAPTSAPSLGGNSRQTLGPLIAVNGVNQQLQSDLLNSAHPTFDTVAFAFDVPAEATGTRVIEFTNATFANACFVQAAISRNPDDATGAEGFAFPSRGGLTSGNLEVTVNAASEGVILQSGRWYLVLRIVDMAVMHALPNGYQADRLMWLRDTTVR